MYEKSLFLLKNSKFKYLIRQNYKITRYKNVSLIIVINLVEVLI